MTTNLEQHIQTTPLIDTHEHLHKEDMYVNNGPDVLADLFGMYIPHDLMGAGASEANVERLLDSNDSDIEGRWQGVEAAWQLAQFTGYGEATRYMAKLVYDMDEITLDTIEQAAARNREIRQPGQRLHLLRDVANLDHVQVDDFLSACLPDESGKDFFLYDLSWARFTNAEFDIEAVEQETGVAITDLATLKQAIAAMFDKYGSMAIAIKSQHAYNRTLEWHDRTDAEAEAVLQQYLSGEELTLAGKLCLGDWCFARGIEQAIEHNLPVKIHTGYLAGSIKGYANPDGTRAGHLAPLLVKYPDATFVLMHIAYPYSDELIGLAKHFPNTYIDMCWAWSINPYHATDFVRRAIHGIPLNKIFAFGGDCFWPTQAVGYAMQARKWLTYALRGEVNDGLMSEAQAIQIATQWMQNNQRTVFDLEGTRAEINAYSE